MDGADIIVYLFFLLFFSLILFLVIKAIRAYPIKREYLHLLQLLIDDEWEFEEKHLQKLLQMDYGVYGPPDHIFFKKDKHLLKMGFKKNKTIHIRGKQAIRIWEQVSLDAELNIPKNIQFEASVGKSIVSDKQLQNEMIIECNQKGIEERIRQDYKLMGQIHRMAMIFPISVRNRKLHSEIPNGIETILQVTYTIVRLANKLREINESILKENENRERLRKYPVMMSILRKRQKEIRKPQEEKKTGRVDKKQRVNYPNVLDLKSEKDLRILLVSWQSSCVICFQNLKENESLTLLLCCNSTAHSNHLAKWIARDARCPYCKGDLRRLKT